MLAIAGDDPERDKIRGFWPFLFHLVSSGVQLSLPPVGSSTSPVIW